MASGRLDAQELADLISSIDGMETTVSSELSLQCCISGLLRSQLRRGCVQIPDQLTQYYMKRSGIDCKDHEV